LQYAKQPTCIAKGMSPTSSRKSVRREQLEPALRWSRRAGE
jgi:hypothetical protein